MVKKAGFERDLHEVQQVIVAADMREFVHQKCLDLRGRKLRQAGRGEQHNRLPKTERERFGQRFLNTEAGVFGSAKAFF